MKILKQNLRYESDINILIVSDEEMKYIIKIVKLFEESGLWVKGVSKTINHK